MGTSSDGVPSFETYFERANASESLWVQFRRDLHQEPEIGLDTRRTSAKVQEYLGLWGLNFTTGWAKGLNSTCGEGVGVVLDIVSSTNKPNDPVVLLRADMDALPINETVDLPFKSRREGRMHACGHDSHTTMVLAAVKLLHESRDEWKGTIRVMFQPGEEMHYGGKYMVEEGVLDVGGRRVNSAFAFHIIPAGVSGVIIGYPGTVLVGGTNFTIEIYGIGGHIGLPAACRDPVIAAASLIMQIQSLTSKETFGAGVYRHGLVSVAHVCSEGDAGNVTPAKVTLKGVVRSPDRKVLGFLKSRMHDLVRSLELSHRVTGTLKYSEDIPALINNEELVAAHRELTRRASRDPFYRLPIRSSGEYSYTMEDFAFVTSVVPGVMFGMLAGSADEIPGHPPSNVMVHRSNFVLDERVLTRGAAFLAKVAVDELDRLRLPKSVPAKLEL